MRSLASLFGTSPFGPLQEHMAVVARCAAEVPGLMEHLATYDEEGLRASQKAIQALEHEADGIKDQMRDHLPRRLWLPVARGDLLEILDLQDTIADRAEDIGDLLIERRWTLPEAMVVPVRELVALSVETVSATNEVLQSLDEVVEAGFSGPEVGSFRTLIARVMELEEQADGLEAAVRRAVFAHEDELGAVSVMLWLHLIEWIGDLSDFAKKACNRLRLLVAT